MTVEKVRNHHTSAHNIYKKNGDEEDTNAPDGTVPVTTAPVTTAPPMTVSTTVVPVTVYHPLNLQVTTYQRTGAAFEWSMQDATTQETWSLTPGPQRESRYEYDPVREMGFHPRCGDEEADWVHRLNCLEGLQD
ncbi:UNVERIFIED_CONTAM: hypothetical protein K2H54_034304 [Gekko kuhli]